MMLSANDRLLVIAALQWAAMEHEKQSRLHAAAHRAAESCKAAHFSVECTRLVSQFQAGR